MTSRTPSRHAIAFALAHLATTADYPRLRQEILDLLPISHGGFVGEHASLNVLVEYGREFGASALDPVWEVVERKRRQKTPPSEPTAHPDSDPGVKPAPQLFKDRKNQYQASYMAQRRQRLRSAVELYQKLHNTTLTAEERRALQNSIQTTWMMWRNELLQGLPPGGQRNEITQLFWADIDDLLKLGLNGDVTSARKVLAED